MSGHEVWCRLCGCLMRLRRGKFGEFYGCTAYPRCKNTTSLRDAADEFDPPNDNWGYSDYGVGGGYDPNGDFD